MKVALETKELREMLDNNKDCPVVFLVDSDVVGDDYGSWFAGGYSCEEGEVLDCEQDIKSWRNYTDREDFREDVEDYVCKSDEELTDREIDARVEEICKQYEPYWKKAIIVYVEGGEQWTLK